MDEREFCEYLYYLTERTTFPVDVYNKAIQQINAGEAYEILDEGDTLNKMRSWIDCLRFINQYLDEATLGRIGDVNICFEYKLKNRWIDAIIVCSNKIIVLEFKSGTNTNQATILSYISQVNKYYNRLSHRHKGIVEAITAGKMVVEKYLVFTNRAVIGKVEFEDIVLTADTFHRALDAVTDVSAPENIEIYLDTETYFDPTITGAFAALLKNGVVNYVNADNQNVQACQKIISKKIGNNNRELNIILVKGGPGTGKTGTAFTLLQKCIEAGQTNIQYVTGNNNLEKYFSAMAEEAARNNELHDSLEGIAESLIGHINVLYDPKNYCDVYLRKKKDVQPICIDEDILLIDEAQRLWNALNIAVKSYNDGYGNWKDVYTAEEQNYIYLRNLSETFLLLFGAMCGIYRNHRNKCIVLFLGNGQEINNGEENGEEEVIKAIGRIGRAAQKNKIGVKVYVPEREDVESLSGYPVEVQLVPDLMLVNNQRNDEGDPQLNVVTNILENVDKLSGSQNLYRVYDDFEVIRDSIISEEDDEDYSIGLFVNSYDTYRQNGEAVYDFIDRGKSYRINGIGKKFYDFFYGLECNNLEKFATQFDSQGLELDNTVVIWGNTLLWRGNRWVVNDNKINGKSRFGNIWVHCKKVNSLLARVINHSKRAAADRLDYNEVKEQFVKNAYRVLLTRARQSTYLYVQDQETYNHLCSLLNP